MPPLTNGEHYRTVPARLERVLQKRVGNSTESIRSTLAARICRSRSLRKVKSMTWLLKSTKKTKGTYKHPVAPL